MPTATPSPSPTSAPPPVYSAYLAELEGVPAPVSSGTLPDPTSAPPPVYGAYLKELEGAAPPPVDRSEIPKGDFGLGWKSGVKGMQGLAYGVMGLMGQAIGKEEMKNWGIRKMQEKEFEAGKYTGRVTEISAITNVDDFIDWFQFVAGQLSPYIIETAMTTLAGAAIGSAGGPGGTVAGGIYGLTGKTATKAVLMKMARKEVLSAAEKKLAKGALIELGTKGGMVAGVYPLGVGELFGETVKAGDPQVGLPLAAAVPYTLAETVVPGRLFGKLRRAATGGVTAAGREALLKSANKQVLTSAEKKLVAEAGKHGGGGVLGALAEIPRGMVTEAATELTQEEILIQSRALLDPEYDVLGEEAGKRREGAWSYGMVGGGLFGGGSAIASAGIKSVAGSGNPPGGQVRATEAMDMIQPKKAAGLSEERVVGYKGEIVTGVTPPDIAPPEGIGEPSQIEAAADQVLANAIPPVQPAVETQDSAAAPEGPTRPARNFFEGVAHEQFQADTQFVKDNNLAVEAFDILQDPEALREFVNERGGEGTSLEVQEELRQKKAVENKEFIRENDLVDESEGLWGDYDALNEFVENKKQDLAAAQPTVPTEEVVGEEPVPTPPPEVTSEVAPTEAEAEVPEDAPLTPTEDEDALRKEIEVEEWRLRDAWAGLARKQRVALLGQSGLLPEGWESGDLQLEAGATAGSLWGRLQEVAILADKAEAVARGEELSPAPAAEALPVAGTEARRMIRPPEVQARAAKARLGLRLSPEQIEARIAEERAKQTPEERARKETPPAEALPVAEIPERVAGVPVAPPVAPQLPTRGLSPEELLKLPIPAELEGLTSDEIQEKIDDLTDVLLERGVPLDEIAEDPEIQALFNVRFKIDEQQLREFIGFVQADFLAVGLEDNISTTVLEEFNLDTEIKRTSVYMAAEYFEESIKNTKNALGRILSILGNDLESRFGVDIEMVLGLGSGLTDLGKKNLKSSLAEKSEGILQVLERATDKNVPLPGKLKSQEEVFGRKESPVAPAAPTAPEPVAPTPPVAAEPAPEPVAPPVLPRRLRVRWSGGIKYVDGEPILEPGKEDLAREAIISLRQGARTQGAQAVISGLTQEQVDIAKKAQASFLASAESLERQLEAAAPPVVTPVVTPPVAPPAPPVARGEELSPAPAAEALPDEDSLPEIPVIMSSALKLPAKVTADMVQRVTGKEDPMWQKLFGPGAIGIDFGGKVSRRNEQGVHVPIPVSEFSKTIKEAENLISKYTRLKDPATTRELAASTIVQLARAAIKDIESQKTTPALAQEKIDHAAKIETSQIKLEGRFPSIAKLTAARAATVHRDLRDSGILELNDSVLDKVIDRKISKQAKAPDIEVGTELEMGHFASKEQKIAIGEYVTTLMRMPETYENDVFRTPIFEDLESLVSERKEEQRIDEKVEEHPLTQLQKRVRKHGVLVPPKGPFMGEYLANIPLEYRSKKITSSAVDVLIAGLSDEFPGLIVADADISELGTLLKTKKAEIREQFIGMTEESLPPVTEEESTTEEEEFIPDDGDPPEVDFSRGPTSGQGMTVTAVQEAIKTLVAKFTGLPEGTIKVVQSISDLPVKAPSDAHAVVSGNSIYVVSDNIGTVETARRAVLHEVVGHLGMRNLIGDRFTALLDNIYRRRGQNAMQPIIEAYFPKGDFDSKNPEHRRRVAEEHLARLAESGKTPSILKQAYGIIREWLRKLGFAITFSDADLNILLTKARKALETTEGEVSSKPSFEPVAASLPAPTFYSKMIRAIAAKLPDKGTAEEYYTAILAYQAKGAFKQEELDWSGLTEWLDEQGTRKIDKSDVIIFLAANNIEIKDRKLVSDPIDTPGIDREGETLYEEHTSPGSMDEYTELLLTLNMKGMDSWYFDPPKDEYFGPHFGDEAANVLAHVRFDTRMDSDGIRVLYIEEIQSDWHAEGRQRGYATGEGGKVSPAEFILLSKKPVGLDTDYLSRYRFDTLRGVTLTPITARTEAEARDEAVDRWIRKSKEKGVPDAPFKRTWHELAMKRMLRYAVENGFGRIAWTTGEQQVERYDLSRKISKIEYFPALRDGTLLAYDHSGQTVLDKEGIPENKISDYIGKEPAERLLSGPVKHPASELPVQELVGEDLKIGGESLKSLYDEILPAFLRKYTKKWGAKVESTVFSGTEPGKYTIWEKSGWEQPFILQEFGSIYSSYATEAEAVAVRDELELLEQEPFTAHSLTINEDMQDSLLEGQPLFKLPVDEESEPQVITAEDASSLFPHVEENLDEARKGVHKAPFLERVKESAATMLRDFRRTFTHIDPKKFPNAYNIFRIFVSIPRFARGEAYKQIYSFVGDLNKLERSVFGMNLLLPDMIKDIESGLITEEEGLPFNYQTLAEVKADLVHFQEQAERIPLIVEGLEKRNKFMREMKVKLVDEGLLPKSVLDDDRYYHHQVLEYMVLRERFTPFTTAKDLRVHKKGWQKARTGSEKDYSTEYLESEFTVIAEEIASYETSQALRKIDKYHNTRKEQDATVKEENDVRMQGKLGEDYEETMLPYRQRIAIANTALGKLAAEGKLYLPEYDDLIEDLGDSYNEYIAAKKDFPEDPSLWGRVGTEDGRWFSFLSGLISQGQEGSRDAAGFMTAVVDRNQFIEETLGKDFLTFDMRLPEGTRTWAPKEGQAWFWANTISDRTMRDLLEGSKVLEESDVKSVRARGADYQWVLPIEIADTMDDVADTNVDEILALRISRIMVTNWKRWVLLNPLSFFHYNLNNMSGDADVAFAYDPRIFREFKPAMVDLKRDLGNKASEELRTELRGWSRTDVLSSGFVMHEAADIDGEFEAMMNPSKSVIRRIWGSAQAFTNYRENILRLATARHVKKRFEAGDKNIYGASDPEVIDAIEDITERSAMIARELIGDYGAVSKAGQWISTHMIPFYRWMEINAPRYVRLMRNVKHEGRDGAALRMSGALAWKSSILGMKMAGFYVSVSMFNNTFFPDEEEDLGESGRRQLHLILGRRDDGSIRTLRIEGAFSDALKWFALEDAPDDFKDLVTGKETVWTKIKEAGGAPPARFFHGSRPFVKALYAIPTRRTLWPKVWSPRPIRDRGEYIASMFSMGMPYRHLVGKPTRGWAQDLESALTYNTDPGEQAYWDTRSTIFKFLEKSGQEKPGFIPSTKSNALYYYKQALRYGDFKAAEKYRKKYFLLGGSYSGMKLSLKFAAPTALLTKDLRGKYFASLSEKERERLAMARKWYTTVYVRRRAMK